MTPPEHPSIEAQLAEMAALPEGWDTYGARPIAPEAIDAVRQFVAELSVVPRTCSGLAVEWRDGENGFDVEFSADGKLEALAAFFNGREWFSDG